MSSLTHTFVSGIADSSDTSLVRPVDWNAEHSINIPINKNVIINGCMRVVQRGTSFTSATTPANSDDTYLMDRWNLLSDGNDIVDVTQVTTPVPVGAYSAACFDIETEDKKWGIIQILEARDSAKFIGGTVSLQFKAAMGASDTSTLLRAAVLSWSSTADTVTSDVVNAWGAEGTNPTVVANWTLENTPAALDALTVAYQTYKIEGISIDTASTTNIAVFIWSDDMTNAVGDLVYISDVQLELGSVATPFEFRPYQQELALCQRYAHMMNSADGSDGYMRFLGGQNISTTVFNGSFIFPVPMRVAPTLTAGGAASTKAIYHAGTITGCSNVPTITQASPFQITIEAPVAAGLTAGQASHLMANNSMTTSILLTAEL